VNSQKVTGRKSMQSNTSGEDTTRLSALLAHQTPTDPDLARIIDAWPALPLPVRAAVLALVESSQRCRREVAGAWAAVIVLDNSRHG
jgi:hypothetical protein